jgi:antitoxin component of MazEF toxin-antitoxin module
MVMISIDSIQKVIKVGDSIAVTIPAKEAKAKGIKPGMMVRSKHEILDEQKSDKNIGVVADYEKFTAQYGSALKNLADR